MNPHHRPAELLVVLAAFVGCGKEQAVKPDKTEPAHVAHHVDETDLNTVTLTPQAETRLGIQLAEVQRTKVRRKRTLGGEVMLPPGQTIVVTAPIAGTLELPADAKALTPGDHVATGQTLFRFKPLLSAERDVLTPSERVRMAQSRADIATVQLEAQRQVESAKLEVEAAQLAFDRASQLFRSKAGSQRVVDEAETQLMLAKEAQQTADQRSEFLSGIKLDEAAGELQTRTIETPVDGVLQGLDAAPGETVAAGDVLFSVIKTDRVWVRVPVYVGQWREIDTSQPAMITEFGQLGDVDPRPADYVSAPPSADPIAATADVFYALDNSDGKLYPGQKLSVSLPLKSRDESLVIPYRAVLYDVQGGAWVYLQHADHVYARQRVAIEYVDGELAILANGPAKGNKVVTDGAAELFGTEFGVGH